MYSQLWGFSVDLPVCYEFVSGNARDTFSFESPLGARLDLIVYHPESSRDTIYVSIEAMAYDIQARLGNRGDIDFFTFDDKRSFIMELVFQLPGEGTMAGWALGMELAETAQGIPMLFAMAYGPAGHPDLELFHVSALDSLSPLMGKRLIVGPMTEYAYPRDTPVLVRIFDLDAIAIIYDSDAEAAQALIDREFEVLRFYEHADNWQEAWARFYRAIYRDSFDRLADLAFQVERTFNVPPTDNRNLAEQVLTWVQGFEYERNFFGSDFLNLITASVHGRGDCDNKAMLWAIILEQAGIRSAIMVSRQHSHAMGLADLPGSGARFPVQGRNYLVAEPNARVSIGLIEQSMSAIDQWLGVVFE